MVSQNERDLVPRSLLPVVEEALKETTTWAFDAFRLTEITQNHPLSTLGFWVLKQCVGWQPFCAIKRCRLEYCMC